jgi:tRNA-dihydrouridine synthase B
MAGVTDAAMRLLCHEQGAAWSVSEMLSAKGWIYSQGKNKVAQELITRMSGEGVAALQLFGREPDYMAEAAARLEGAGFDFFDINFGCPAPKIAGNGEGSALMKDPVRAFEIMTAVKEACPIPVTVKIRAGFDEGHICAPRYAEMAEKAGLAAVCVHGRTREQMYRPPVDLEVIKDCVSAVHIPVIGNGEIMTVKDALYMKEYTGCSSLMLARGTLGNPFLFSQIKAALQGKEVCLPDYATRIKTAKLHFELLLEY